MSDLTDLKLAVDTYIGHAGPLIAAQAATIADQAGQISALKAQLAEFAGDAATVEALTAELNAATTALVPSA